MENKKIKIQIKNRFFGAVIFEYEAEGNTLRETVLKAIECNADLRNANLRDADLRDANLCNADLRNANLCNANLRGADLCDADLCNANLRDANLCNANLRDANLCNANLRDANLCNADLRDANFTGAVLDYDDDNAGYGSTEGLVKKIAENSNLRLTVLYENHDSYASAWGSFWRNLIIVRRWDVVEKKEEKKNRLSEEQKAIVKAFATMHGVDKLEYREYGGSRVWRFRYRQRFGR